MRNDQVQLKYTMKIFIVPSGRVGGRGWEGGGEERDLGWVENLILSFMTKNCCHSNSANFLTLAYALQVGSHPVKMLCRD